MPEDAQSSEDESILSSGSRACRSVLTLLFVPQLVSLGWFGDLRRREPMPRLVTLLLNVCLNEGLGCLFKGSNRRSICNNCCYCFELTFCSLLFLVDLLSINLFLQTQKLQQLLHRENKRIGRFKVALPANDNLEKFLKLRLPCQTLPYILSYNS